MELSSAFDMGESGIRFTLRGDSARPAPAGDLAVRFLREPGAVGARTLGVQNVACASIGR